MGCDAGSPHALTPQAGSNLERLRAILPKCDVLLVTATQQKYRSAPGRPGVDGSGLWGAGGLCADACRDRRRRARRLASGVGGFVRDGPHLLCRFASCVGRRPGGSSAARRVRGLVGSIDAADGRGRRQSHSSGEFPRSRGRDARRLPGVDRSGHAGRATVAAAILEQRGLLAAQLVRDMRAELLASRRPWEQRLLAQTTSRWGFSPFSLVLRGYQGLGDAADGGAAVSRADAGPSGALGGDGGRPHLAKTTRSTASPTCLDRAASTCWDPVRPAESRADRAGLCRRCRADARCRVARRASAGSRSRGGRLRGRRVGRFGRTDPPLAERHTGWFTRWRYEGLLAAMLGFLLYRLGKNFFYDSWLATHPSPMFGLEFYLSAGFWFVLWCLLLLWAFCSRLRRGLRSELDRLAERWLDRSSAVGLFADLEDDCRRCDRFRQGLMPCGNTYPTCDDSSHRLTTLPKSRRASSRTPLTKRGQAPRVVLLRPLGGRLARSQSPLGRLAGQLGLWTIACAQWNLLGKEHNRLHLRNRHHGPPMRLILGIEGVSHEEEIIGRLIADRSKPNAIRDQATPDFDGIETRVEHERDLRTPNHDRMESRIALQCHGEIAIVGQHADRRKPRASRLLASVTCSSEHVSKGSSHRSGQDSPVNLGRVTGMSPARKDRIAAAHYDHHDGYGFKQWPPFFWRSNQPVTVSAGSDRQGHPGGRQDTYSIVDAARRIRYGP